MAQVIFTLLRFQLTNSNSIFFGQSLFLNMWKCISYIIFITKTSNNILLSSNLENFMCVACKPKDID